MKNAPRPPTHEGFLFRMKSPPPPGTGLPLSAIHFRGHPIRRASCYALLGWFQLPWPHPRCLHRATLFVVSGAREVGRLCRGYWFIPHRQPCLPRMAHGAPSHPRQALYSNESRPHAHCKFENRSTSTRKPAPLIIIFTRRDCDRTGARYPMRNVGGNQLLDGSMSLSLLYRAATRQFAR